MLTKKDIKILVDIFLTKDDAKKFATKKDLRILKNEMATNHAEILLEIKSLKGEKTVGYDQDKRKQKVLEIHNDALKRNKILSEEEVLQIDQMSAF